MGQIVTLFQSVPIIINEAINIVIIALVLFTLLKGLVNVWKCGLLQLLYFLLLSGRSCSETLLYDRISVHNFTFNHSVLSMTMPLSCSKNTTHHYIKVGNSGFELTFTNQSILNGGSPGSCNRTANRLVDTAEDIVLNEIHEHIGKYTGKPCHKCDTNEGKVTIQYNLTCMPPMGKLVDKRECPSFPRRVVDFFRRVFQGSRFWSIRNSYLGQKNHSISGWCSDTSYQFLIIQNVTWGEHCQFQAPSVTGMASLFLVRAEKYYMTRRLQSLFHWDEDTRCLEAGGRQECLSGPGGYCIAIDNILEYTAKCFQNQAMAQCNERHDQEFCDMISLIKYNQLALKTFQNQTERALELFRKSINGLINDNLLVRNRLKDILGIPYCNYSRFWYVNDTKTGHHSLPKCWMTSNGSYLDEVHFSSEVLIEAQNLVSQILMKEYTNRQGKTPLGLMDMLMFSISFYLLSVFLHLLRIPTHRHLVGGVCPKPHRLTKMGICSCGRYAHPGVSVRWARD